MESENMFSFELRRGFNYTLEQPISRSHVVSTDGTVFSWVEMQHVLEECNFLEESNIPSTVTVCSFLSLKNTKTGVVKNFFMHEFNSSKSSNALNGDIKFFVVGKSIPTVSDIKPFVDNCKGCESSVFCKKHFNLEDTDPAFFNMCCTPCICSLDEKKNGVIYRDRLNMPDKRVSEFFTKKPIDLTINSSVGNVIRLSINER